MFSSDLCLSSSWTTARPSKSDQKKGSEQQKLNVEYIFISNPLFFGAYCQRTWEAKVEWSGRKSNSLKRRCGGDGLRDTLKCSRTFRPPVPAAARLRHEAQETRRVVASWGISLLRCIIQAVTGPVLHMEEGQRQPAEVFVAGVKQHFLLRRHRWIERSYIIIKSRFLVLASCTWLVSGHGTGSTCVAARTITRHGKHTHTHTRTSFTQHAMSYKAFANTKKET